MVKTRLYLALLLTVLLAACAVVPPAPREAPLSYPPLARERMLRIAIAEWEEWGRQVSDRPPGPAQESDPTGFPRLQAYWRAVPEGRDIITRNRALFRAGYEGQWQQDAWSAAFISFVMQTAGIDAREFTPSAAHGTSIDGMIADARAFPHQAPFIPHRVRDRVAAPGD